MKNKYKLWKKQLEKDLENTLKYKVPKMRIREHIYELLLLDISKQKKLKELDELSFLFTVGPYGTLVFSKMSKDIHKLKTLLEPTAE